MRISQGATSTVALVSLVLSVGNLVILAYIGYLEPKKMEMRAREIEATLELSKNIVQLTEYQKAERERMEQEKARRGF